MSQTPAHVVNMSTVELRVEATYRKLKADKAEREGLYGAGAPHRIRQRQCERLLAARRG